MTDQNSRGDARLNEPRGDARPNPTHGSDWQHDMLRSLAARPQIDAAASSGASRPQDDQPGDRTVLRPAPQRVPAMPAQTTHPGSPATPARAERSGRTNLVPGPARPVISAVPPADAPARPAPPRVEAATVAGPGPEFGEQLARLGRVRAESLLRRGWRRLVRLVGRDGFPQAFAEAAEQAQASVTTGRRIAVVSADGGVGRSTLAACLGLLYASLRRDFTAVVSLGTAPSPIAPRLGVGQAIPTWQVAQSCLAEESPEPLHFLLRFAKVSASLVCSGATTADRAVPADQQGALHRNLSRSAAVSLLDCAPGLLDRSTRQAIAESHALLLVGPATAVGVDHLRQVLDQVAGSRPVVVALVQVDRAAPGLLDDAERRLTRPGTTVHTIGWSRHLAAGGHLHLDHLSEPHRLALARLAADLLEQARKAG